MTGSLVGKSFKSNHGAITHIEYANNEGQGPRESFGVISISFDGIRSGTTIGGPVFRHQLEQGQIVEIQEEEYRERYEQSRDWLAATHRQ